MSVMTVNFTAAEWEKLVSSGLSEEIFRCLGTRQLGHRQMPAHSIVAVDEGTNNPGHVNGGGGGPSLMDVIPPAARELIENSIIQSMSVIDWGKAMARANEIIQKHLLIYCNINAYDPELDEDCPAINTTNNSPGFDIVVQTADGQLKRIQSKLRQVKGVTPFSQQSHFETTRRHSKKNQGAAVQSGHVAYANDEFDYVMVTLINVRDGWEKRKSVDAWSFSLIPIAALIDEERGCCFTHIPAAVLKRYEYIIDPSNPPHFT